MRYFKKISDTNAIAYDSSSADDAPHIEAMLAEISAGTATEVTSTWVASLASGIALDEYKMSVKQALEKADLTAIRIGEAVTLGLNTWTNADIVSWTLYRRELRAQLSASTVGTLPVKPAYPAGT